MNACHDNKMLVAALLGCVACWAFRWSRWVGADALNEAGALKGAEVGFSRVACQGGVIPKTGPISTRLPQPGTFNQSAAPDWRIPHIGNAADAIVTARVCSTHVFRVQGLLRLLYFTKCNFNSAIAPWTQNTRLLWYCLWSRLPGPRRRKHNSVSFCFSAPDQLDGG